MILSHKNSQYCGGKEIAQYLNQNIYVKKEHSNEQTRNKIEGHGRVRKLSVLYLLK